MTNLSDIASLPPIAVALERTDVLSQVLTLVRLRGKAIHATRHDVEWKTRHPAGAAHFHFVEQGSTWIASASSERVRLAAGDLVLLPHGTGHEIGGEPARLVCGQFVFEGDPLSSILSSLPAVVHIRRGDGPTPSWLQAIVEFLLQESRQQSPGSFLMISRLIDLLVIRALRAWAEAHPAQRGWLGGLADPRIGRTLAAIHAEPDRSWTLLELASIAGMSRSVFAQRFTEAIGESPLRYVTHWKLTVASDLLRSGSVRVTDAARRIGFSSEAAFSRAFKSRFGYPPGEAKAF